MAVFPEILFFSIDIRPLLLAAEPEPEGRPGSHPLHPNDLLGLGGKPDCLVDIYVEKKGSTVHYVSMIGFGFRT